MPHPPAALKIPRKTLQDIWPGQVDKNFQTKFENFYPRKFLRIFNL